MVITIADSAASADSHLSARVYYGLDQRPSPGVVGATADRWVAIILVVDSVRQLQWSDGDHWYATGVLQEVG
jgi:hypothetical protein